MRTTQLATALLLVVAITLPCRAVDWQAFEDPQSVLLTDAFAESIGKLPAQEKATAIARLRAALQSKEVEIRRRAALTLATLGDKRGVPTMIEDLATAEGRDRDNVVVALRILKDKRAIGALRKALDDKSPYVRGIAVAALGELQAVEAYDQIVALTTDKGKKPGGREDGKLDCLQISPAQMACYALGAMGDQRAVPVLTRLREDRELKTFADQALGMLARQQADGVPSK